MIPVLPGFAKFFKLFFPLFFKAWYYMVTAIFFSYVPNVLPVYGATVTIYHGSTTEHNQLFYTCNIIKTETGKALRERKPPLRQFITPYGIVRNAAYMYMVTPLWFDQLFLV